MPLSSTVIQEVTLCTSSLGVGGKVFEEIFTIVIIDSEALNSLVSRDIG